MTMSAEDNGWFWGNRRGGGGAPLKDKHGSVITNLRLASKGVIEVDYCDVNGREHSGFNDPYSAVPSPSNGNTKKFMSALRDMTSNPSERDEKIRKDLEYKAMLRDQIAENRRRKSQDAEHDKSRHKSNYLKGLQEPQVPESTNLSNQHYNANNSNHTSTALNQYQYYNGMPHPPSNYNFCPPQQALNVHQPNLPPIAGYSGPTFNSPNAAFYSGPNSHHCRENLNTTHAYQDTGYDENSHGRVHESTSVENPHQRAGDNNNGTAQNEFVRVQAREYEELTHLCSRLKQEQETLRREVHEQALFIQNLANGKLSAGRRSVLPTLPTSTGNSRGPRNHTQLRSKSEMRGSIGGNAAPRNTTVKPGTGFGSSSARSVLSSGRQERGEACGSAKSPRSAPVETQRQCEKFANRGLSQALKGPQRVGPAGVATALRLKMSSQTKGPTSAEYNLTAKLRAAAISSTSANRRSISAGRLELSRRIPTSGSRYGSGEGDGDGSAGGAGTNSLNGFQKLSLSRPSYGNQQPLVTTYQDDTRLVGSGMDQNSNYRYDSRDNFNTNQDELVGESRYIQMK